MPPTLPVTGDSHRTSVSQRDKREYDRLRTLARNAADKRGDCYKRAREAYDRRDRALAGRLSNEGKKYGKQMNKYNKRAWKFIFKLNNLGRPPTTIDLHDLFVGEAVACLLKRMNEVKASKGERIHVIVGQGIHAPGGQPRIKPAVEKLCQDRGLTFTYQMNRRVENRGVIIILLEDYAMENIEDTKDTEDSDVDLRDVSDSEGEESYSNTITAPSASRPAAQAPPSPPPSEPPIYTRRPPVASQSYIRPVASDSYTRPPVENQLYTRPPVASQPYTRPLVASQPYTRPPAASDSYTRPPVTNQSHTRPPTTIHSYTRPPVNQSYTPSPVTNQSYTSPLLSHPSRTTPYTPARPQYNYRSIDAEERGVRARMPSEPEGGCSWFGGVILVATIIGLGIFFLV